MIVCAYQGCDLCNYDDRYHYDRASFLASDDSSYVTGIELCVDVGIAQI